MKIKIIGVIMLIVVSLILSAGCGPSIPPSCTTCGFQPYTDIAILVYPDNVGAISFSGANGCMSYSSRWYSCNQITVLSRAGVVFVANPNSINLQSPPATLTLTGSGISTTYGMPVLDYIGWNGALIGRTTAYYVSNDGTTLQAYLPNLSSVYSGSYTIWVTNRDCYGNYTDTIGYANISAFGRDRLDTDEDGWYDDEDCAPYDPDSNPGAEPDCSGTYWDRNCNGINDQDDYPCNSCIEGPNFCEMY